MNPENQNPVTTPPLTQQTPDILSTGVATQQPITPSSEQSPVQSEVPKPKSKVLPLILIIVLVITGLGLLGYWVYQTYISSPKQINQESTPTPIATTDPTVNWETYTSFFFNYSIKYPPDWILDKSNTEVSSEETTELIISKGDYQIKIMWPDAFKPAICIFDDQSRTDYPEMTNFCEGEFVEILSHDGNFIYRRLVKPSQNITGGGYLLGVYTKSKEGYYATVPPIDYVVPSNYEIDVIKIMDQILSTFKLLSQENASSKKDWVH